MSAELEENRRAAQVLSALDRAAAAIATSTSEQAAYEAASKTLDELGFRTTVLTIDQASGRLMLRQIDVDEQILRRAERLVGLKRDTFSFAPDATSFHVAVLANRQTVFSADALDVAAQLLPQAPPAIVRTILRLVGVTRMIGSPIIVDGGVIGLVVVSLARAQRRRRPCGATVLAATQ